MTASSVPLRRATYSSRERSQDESATATTEHRYARIARVGRPFRHAWTCLPPAARVDRGGRGLERLVADCSPRGSGVGVLVVRPPRAAATTPDRKSTRLNSSHA